MFSLEQALAQAGRIMSERQKSRSTAYTLYYSNDSKRYEGKMTGFTIKQLIGEFRALGRGYKYAFITKINDDTKVLRYYNSDLGKKFYSLTRTRTKKVK